MKKHGITFDELRELLLHLGFSETLEKTRISFDYSTTGTFLLFRVYDPKEMVNERDMVVVRRQLLDNGLIEPSAFDRFLQRVSA